MRNYWIKIASGAVVVFVVGMAGWYLVMGAKERVVDVIDSAVSLSIPLPFDLVPFQVDGERVGSLKRLVIHRDSPKEVNWIEVEAKLNEEGQWAELADCRLSIDDFEGLDEGASFACNTELPRGYVEFGEITFRESGESLVLWVPREAAAELRHAGRERIELQHARMYERQVIIAEKQARMAARAGSEVAATVAQAIAEAFADSIPAEVMAELKAAGITIESSGTGASQGIRIEVRTADSVTTSVRVTDQ